MNLVYTDEVKCDRWQPYYYLCALAVPETEIERVESAMDAIAEVFFGSRLLDRATEFHASHIVSGKGLFKDVSAEKRAALFKQLAHVINDHPDVGRILIRLDPKRIDRADYQRIGFMFLVERVDDLMKTRRSKALLIVDHDQQFANMNVSSLSTFKAYGTEFAFGREIQNVVDTVHHTHSHHSRLIQLADVYAYGASMLEKKNSWPLRQELSDYIKNLPNFSWPTKFKHWPTDPIQWG